jgi:hypothetical protein
VRQRRIRFWIEAALAAFSGFLFVLTGVMPDWIERVFGVEPDAGSGALEWGIVAFFALVTLVFVAVARREWRRPARLSA